MPTSARGTALIFIRADVGIGPYRQNDKSEFISFRTERNCNFCNRTLVYINFLTPKISEKNKCPVFHIVHRVFHREIRKNTCKLRVYRCFNGKQVENYE